MTSSDHEPPPMVPSPRNRVVQVAGCLTLPGYPDEVCRAADAVRLIEQAYRDGWNFACAAQAERDQINFNEGREFERRRAANQTLDELAAETERLRLYPWQAPPQPGDATSDDEARRRKVISDACDRAFEPAKNRGGP